MSTTNSHLVLLVILLAFALLGGVILVAFALLGGVTMRRQSDVDQTGFDQNYAVDWGRDHVKFLDNGRLVQLSMDKSSGSGFSSRLTYNSGFFHLAMKTPKQNTAGVVTAFYLSSNTSSHDELDFEFLGSREGEPVTFQTNIFINGYGNREQRISLWFDPSDGFHDYKILWNPYHIVFFVDDIPIRVFKNQTSGGIIEYPSQPMKIITSLWNGEGWATNGGKDKINWADSPFIAQFQGFSIDGCSSNGSDNHVCASSNFWWNGSAYKDLTPAQETAYQNVQKRITYDYCSDKQRFSVMPPECHG